MNWKKMYYEVVRVTKMGFSGKFIKPEDRELYAREYSLWSKVFTAMMVLEVSALVIMAYLIEKYTRSF